MILILLEQVIWISVKAETLQSWPTEHILLSTLLGNDLHYSHCCHSTSVSTHAKGLFFNCTTRWNTRYHTKETIDLPAYAPQYSLNTTPWTVSSEAVLCCGPMSHFTFFFKPMFGVRRQFVLVTWNSLNFLETDLNTLCYRIMFTKWDANQVKLRA